MVRNPEFLTYKRGPQRIWGMEGLLENGPTYFLEMGKLRPELVTTCPGSGSRRDNTASPAPSSQARRPCTEPPTLPTLLGFCEAPPLQGLGSDPGALPT